MNTPIDAIGVLQRNIQIDIRDARATIRELQVRLSVLENEWDRIDQLIGTLSQEDQDAIKDGK
jgi:hypothetical protein